MLPDLVCAELRILFFPERSSSSSQDSDESSSSSSSTTNLPDLFADRVVEPLVLKHLNQAVRDYIDIEDPVEDYLGAPDVAIQEAAHTARLEVLEVKEESIKEIKQAEIDVVERLTGVDWNLIGNEIMGLTPSQESYSDGPDSRVGTTTVRREEPLGQEGGGRKEMTGDRRLRNHSDIRAGTSTSEARGGKKSFFQTGGLGYASEATTEDVTEDSPSPPQSSDAYRGVRLGSSRRGWRNVVREESRTSSNPGIRQHAFARDHGARLLGSDSGAWLGTEVGDAHSGDDCDNDDEREDDSGRENDEAVPGPQQGESFGLADRECSWSTTEPDTESDVPHAGRAVG